MTPLVSIIVPVYNGANYLKQAVDSALAQTYKNIEVIVVNDGSDDNGLTEAIASSYGDNIRYFYKTNGGVASALNAGIRLASGDYISWLSHDDLYRNNKIERQVAFLASIPSARVAVYSDYDAVDANNEFIRAVKLEDSEAGGQAFLILLFRSSIHGCSLLLPKKCFTEIGYFDENLRTTQDYDLWFKLLKNGYEFRHLPEVLISSRWHKEQGTHTLYKIAHGEIEALYVGAVDMFYDDIVRMPVKTVVDLIIDLRDRKLRETSNHLLKSIKLRNKRLYQQLYGEYAGLLFTSKVKLMAAKPIHLCKVITDLLNIRGGA